jgi:hypothetical protein
MVLEESTRPQRAIAAMQEELHRLRGEATVLNRDSLPVANNCPRCWSMWRGSMGDLSAIKRRAARTPT